MTLATARFCLALSMSAIFAVGCGGGGGSSGPQTGTATSSACGPYPPQTDSAYVLPYEVGKAYVVSQGNCSNFSHKAGTGDQNAYDFLMPIGTPIVAARTGTVSLVVVSFSDGTGVPGEENVVGVTHEDGSIALYFHITRDGALVSLGQFVRSGDVIALSGNSGASTEPHLHFVVVGPPGTGAPGTLPVTFSNTRPHPDGLVQSQTYLALGLRLAERRCFPGVLR